MKRRVLALCSGGLDSVVLTHHVNAVQQLGAVISFNYGQRHVKELMMAKLAAERFGVDHVVVDLRALPIAKSTSALTQGVKVPEGHYAEESMKATVVPNRNAILISVATGYAIDHGMDGVAIAVHGGDHFIYPDCRPEFVFAMNAAMRIGNVGFSSPSFSIASPFLFSTKADIVRRGKQLKVPFRDTWSCYKGGDVHCGACGTCYERREAFILAGVKDPTEYEATPDFEAPDVVGEGMAAAEDAGPVGSSTSSTAR